jgi:hypothetical protein
MNPTNINEISVFVGDFCFLQRKKQKFRPIPIFLFKIKHREDGVLLKGQDFGSVRAISEFGAKGFQRARAVASHKSRQAEPAPFWIYREGHQAP